MVTLILYQINAFCQCLFNVLTKRWCGSTGFRKQKASSFIIFFLLSYIFSATKHNSNTNLIKKKNRLQNRKFSKQAECLRKCYSRKKKKKKTIKKKQQCTLETHLQNNKSSSKFLRKSIPDNVTIENWARNPTTTTSGNTTTTTIVATHKLEMNHKKSKHGFQFPISTKLSNLQSQRSMWFNLKKKKKQEKPYQWKGG